MMIVPQELVAVPMFLTLSRLKMLDTYHGVILALSAEGFAILILYRFFVQLPLEIIEAARIDGANDLQLLWRVVLPLARPAIGTVILLQFIMAWNAFMLPLIVARDSKMLNLQVAMAHFNTQWQIDFRAIMAVGSIITVPVLIVFVLTQRTLIRGITAGAVK
jgi:multiple sugar transport system permease protein